MNMASLGRTSSWNDKTYLTCAETAKLIRLALKREFPGQKFSVRSKTYSGGASITVSWTDGPLSERVDKIVRVFNGADFDGMVDLKTHNTHWLMPDGSVTIASGGGQGSTIPAYVGDPSGPTAKLVSLGANFVFTQRETSEKFRASLVEEFERIYREKYDPDREYEERHFELPPGQLHFHGHPERGSTLLYRLSQYKDAA